MLAEHFLKKYSVQYNKPVTELSPETMQLFMEYDWPGNVRELENLIKRAVVLGGEAPIRKEIAHGIAMAACHRPRAAPAGQRPPATPRTQPRRRPATARRRPPSIAAAAAEAGNYSLKDISRTAAREAERELILKMLQRRAGTARRRRRSSASATRRCSTRSRKTAWTRPHNRINTMPAARSTKRDRSS